MESEIKETEDAKLEIENYFDSRRYDTNFLSDILVLLKPKQ